ncbi:SsrA-binding protein SmpB [Georgenia wangjunii]|uniref:SsrA-binding protein SmpB n=1 Tax=Georgenia wangjunii TaxID=3117730 RepID=UPI002F25EB61
MAGTSTTGGKKPTPAERAKEEADRRTVVARNKKARHDYHIDATYEAGISLTGTEVKSLRAGRASLVDGWVEIDRGEAWLQGVHIPEYTQGTWTNHPVRRKRKLLLHREEIDKLAGKSREKGHTIVPLELYFIRGRAKVLVALARGKREYDKRQTLREQQDNREAQRAMSLRLNR